MVGSFCPERLCINHEPLSHKVARESTGFWEFFEESFMSHLRAQEALWNGMDQGRHNPRSFRPMPAHAFPMPAMPYPDRAGSPPSTIPPLPQERCDKPLDNPLAFLYTKLSLTKGITCVPFYGLPSALRRWPWLSPSPGSSEPNPLARGLTLPWAFPPCAPETLPGDGPGSTMQECFTTQWGTFLKKLSDPPRPTMLLRSIPINFSHPRPLGG